VPEPSQYQKLTALEYDISLGRKRQLSINDTAFHYEGEMASTTDPRIESLVERMVRYISHLAVTSPSASLISNYNPQ
jgi:hypothetical protein